MKKDWNLTQEALDALLAWLDSDREKAGEKYALIQLRLIRFFVSRCCLDAENQADKVINIVTNKVKELANYEGDKALYFYGVAKKVFLEYRPPKIPDPPPDSTDNENDTEEEFARLDECLEELSHDDRWLILSYHQDEKQAKIQNRKRLARQLDITMNALRIRITRTLKQLRRCMENDLEESRPTETEKAQNA